MRNQTALATPALAAHLTHKQADILVYLWDEDPVRLIAKSTPLSGIAECLQEMFDSDMHEGVRPMYFGVSKAAVRTTLNTLIQRGLVMEQPYRYPHTPYVQQDRYYRLTLRGIEATRALL